VTNHAGERGTLVYRDKSVSIDIKKGARQRFVWNGALKAGNLLL
jgi:hypothetical protein